MDIFFDLTNSVEYIDKDYNVCFELKLEAEYTFLKKVK